MLRFFLKGRSRSTQTDILFEFLKRPDWKDSNWNKRASVRLETKILNATSKLFAIAVLFAPIGVENSIVLVSFHRYVCGQYEPFVQKHSRNIHLVVCFSYFMLSLAFSYFFKFKGSFYQHKQSNRSIFLNWTKNPHAKKVLPTWHIL